MRVAAIVLVAWFVVSIPVGIVLGRMIGLGHGPDRR